MTDTKPMRWEERIDKAEARGYFTKEDFRLAASWVDCGCGEQDPRIPRAMDGQPIDRKLYDLGCDFLGDVQNDCLDRARQTLAAIERRSAEILAVLEVGA